MWNKVKKNWEKHFHGRTMLTFIHPALLLGCQGTENMLNQLNMTSWFKDITVNFLLIPRLAMKTVLKISCQSFSAFPTFCITDDDTTFAVIQLFMSNLYTAKL